MTASPGATTSAVVHRFKASPAGYDCACPLFLLNRLRGRRPPSTAFPSSESVYCIRIDSSDILLYRNVPSLVLAHHNVFLPCWEHFCGLSD